MTALRIYSIHIFNVTQAYCLLKPDYVIHVFWKLLYANIQKYSSVTCVHQQISTTYLKVVYTSSWKKTYEPHSVSIPVYEETRISTHQRAHSKYWWQTVLMV